MTTLYSIGSGLIGLVSILTLIGLAIYVATHKPPRNEATRYTLLGIGLLLASWVVFWLFSVIYSLVPVGFEVYWISQNLISTVLRIAGIASLVKAVYAASSPEPSPMRFEPPSVADQPPFTQSSFIPPDQQH